MVYSKAAPFETLPPLLVPERIQMHRRHQLQKLSCTFFLCTPNTCALPTHRGVMWQRGDVYTQSVFQVLNYVPMFLTTCDSPAPA